MLFLIQMKYPLKSNFYYIMLNSMLHLVYCAPQNITNIGKNITVCLSFDPKNKTKVEGLKEFRVIHACALIVEVLMQVNINS